MSKGSSGTAPDSSAPVPWSSSPAHHFEHPRANDKDHEPPSPAPPLPKKRRNMPSSFTKPPVLADYESLLTKNGGQYKREKEDALKQDKGGVKSSKASQTMAELVEKSMFPLQRTSTSLTTRNPSERAKETLAKATEQQPAKRERVPEVFLSDEQKAVVKAVLDEGKSVFFTGSAGTGKSVLMKAIIAQLKHKYRAEPDRFAVTASTGLASCILEGQTLHSWSGIGLGKEPAPELVKKVKRNQKSRQRWIRTKVLIVDEVSMVDGALFDKLEQVARTIRNNGRPFGGIQLVVTGDFFQLPPVPEKNTIAKFVFEAVTWNTCIQHTILLTHVFRQKDEKFAGMLNEMRLGKMSPATVREFKSLSRPLDFRDDLEATEL
jgi:ATP-dependent DNA helicase PIF1